MAEELNVGVYAVVVFKDLDEFEADEHETLLIETLGKFLVCYDVFEFLILDPNHKGNQVSGRSTRRLELLTAEQRKEEREALHHKVLEVFDSLEDDDLITVENVKVSFQEILFILEMF